MAFLSAISIEQVWSIIDLLYGKNKCFAGLQRVIPSGQKSVILLTRVAAITAQDSIRLSS